MKLLNCAIFMLCLKLSQSVENNVCPTIKDYYTIKDNPNCYFDIGAVANVIELIAYYGYVTEIHRVTTKDGYILTMFRILNRNIKSEFSNVHPVFFQHGWMNSAAVFFGKGQNSLPFILSDAGYDVWLGNFRGTEYSEEHVNLTVFDEQYWDYSIDEIGLYDIPANIEYIYHVTGGTNKIVYIGHSLGTTVGMIYSSSFPTEASEKIKLMILMSPAGKIPNTKSLLKYSALFGRPFYKIIKNNDLIRVLSQGNILKTLTRLVCFESPHLLQLCATIANLAVSGLKSDMETKTIPVLLNQIPSGSSLKLLAHISDLIRNNFRKFDYGVHNIEKYGTPDPPDYDLSQIKVPIFIMCSINDWATTAQDAWSLYNSLPPKIRYGFYEIISPNFNHADFQYGRNAKVLVYDKVLQVINNIE